MTSNYAFLITEVVPFKYTISLISTWFLVVLAILGLAMVTLVIHFIVKNGKHTQTPSYAFLLSLCCSFICIAVTVGCSSAYNLYNGGFSLLYSYCEFEGALIIFSYYLTISSLLAIAIDLYCVLILRYYIPIRHAQVAIIGIWISGFVICSWGWYGTIKAHDYMTAVSPGQLVCNVPWDDNEHFQTILISYLIIGYLIFPLPIITFVYTRIFYLYFSSKQKSRLEALSTLARNAAQSQPPSLSSMSPGERKLLLRAVASTGSYIIFVFPYLAAIIYSRWTNTPVSVEMDCFTSVFLGLFELVTLLLLIYFDGLLSSEFKDWFSVARPKPASDIVVEPLKMEMGPQTSQAFNSFDDAQAHGHGGSMAFGDMLFGRLAALESRFGSGMNASSVHGSTFHLDSQLLVAIDESHFDDGASLKSIV